MINYWRTASDKEKREQWSVRSQKSTKKSSPLSKNNTFLGQKKKKKRQKKHALTSNPALNFLQIFLYYNWNMYMKTTVYTVQNDCILICCLKMLSPTEFSCWSILKLFRIIKVSQKDTQNSRKQICSTNNNNTSEKLELLFLTYLSCKNFMQNSLHWTRRYQLLSIRVRHEQAKAQS